jgi:predicted phage tail protein
LGGSISKVDFYNNNTLIGTATESPYTFIWKNVPAGNYSITAKATDNEGLVATSDPVQITVNNPKVAPSVSITSPLVNTTFTAPAAVNISASATDGDGSITKIQFYNNNTLIGTATASPYTFSWNNVPAGNYSITAKATDNDGLVTTSAPVKISVVSNTLPTVSIIKPVNAQHFTAPATIPFVASARDADGKIAKVNFYNGATLLKTVTDAPYNYTWESVPAGSYTITAVAIDNRGERSTSEPISVSVTAKDSVIVKYAPNPATNILSISTLGFEQNKAITVSVIGSGMVLKMVEVPNSSQTIQLDVSSLVKGIYTVKLTCGDKVVSKQFIKM